MDFAAVTHPTPFGALIFGNYLRTVNEQRIISMSPLDSHGKESFVRQTDAVEECLIAELNYGQRDCLASQSALANPVASVLTEGYQKLVNNVEIERAKVKALRVKLNAYRKVKIRNADLRDLSAVRDAVNGLGKDWMR